MNNIGAFTITKDHLSPIGDELCRVGKTSKDYDSKAPTLPFKLYDDDDNLYYEGRAVVDEDYSLDEDNFRALDWAMNDAGCTYIKYRDKKTGKWEIL